MPPRLYQATQTHLIERRRYAAPCHGWPAMTALIETVRGGREPTERPPPRHG